MEESLECGEDAVVPDLNAAEAGRPGDAPAQKVVGAPPSPPGWSTKQFARFR